MSLSGRRPVIQKSRRHGQQRVAALGEHHGNFARANVRKRVFGQRGRTIAGGKDGERGAGHGGPDRKRLCLLDAQQWLQ